MAKLKHGLLSLGGVSGRIGHLVYYTSRGKQCVRRLPKKTGKSTKAQIVQRERFETVNRFLRPFTPLLQVGFRHPKELMTPNNYAASYVFKYALTGQYPNFRVDFSKMLFTRGPLAEAYHAKAENVGKECIRFNWRHNSLSTARGDDRAVLIAVCEDPFMCFFAGGESTRADSIGFLQVPGFAGKKLHTYIGFIDARGKQAADSRYTGELTVTP